MSRALAAPATRRQVEAALTGELGSVREARWIAEEVLGSGSGSDPVAAEAQARIDRLAARRSEGEPLQYVLGHWPFRTLDLVFDRRVLIARPETEQLVDVALRELDALRELTAPANGTPGESVVVDLGTGSGAIGLSLAAETTGWVDRPQIWCCDVSDDALAVATENLATLRRLAPLAADAVTLSSGDWWGALPASLAGRVRLVVSNPPYVGSGEWADLDPGIRSHEPEQALVAGDGRDGTPGLAAIEAVLDAAPRWLARPGTAVIEVAPHQAVAAQAVAHGAGVTAVRVEPDLAGRDRMLVATWR
jgi:release factor glutamine methyltransferase